MKNKIQKILTLIEQKYNVRILYSCEGGSRAWGFASRDSDWDVRFIYVRPLERYLTVFNDNSTTIDRNNSNLVKDFEKFDIDLVGWDLKKTLSHLAKHNTNLISWLTDTQSELTYVETEESERLKQIAYECFCPKTTYNAMIGIANRTFKNFIDCTSSPRTKKYMYLVRPILCCMWIEYYSTIPPVRMENIYNDCLIQPEIKKNGIFNVILRLVEQKKSGTEKDTCARIKSIEDFYLEKKDYYTSISQGLPSFVKTSEELKDLKADIDSNFINFLM